MDAKRILLVENDKDYRDSVQDLLERQGYRVLVAETVEQAVAAAKQTSLDLVILNVRLRDDQDERDDSGLELARQLDEALPKIALTATQSMELELVRRLLLPEARKAKPLVVAVYSKHEGLTGLLKTVESAIGPPDSPLRKVFLSYSPSDKKLAQKIQTTLKNAGLEVWEREWEIFPGDNWAEKTGQALKESDAMVVLLSPMSVESSNLQNDIDYALFNRRFEQRLIPVLVGDPQQIPPEKIPGILRRLNMLSLPENGRTEDLNQVVVALQAAA